MLLLALAVAVVGVCCGQDAAGDTVTELPLVPVPVASPDRNTLEYVSPPFNTDLIIKSDVPYITCGVCTRFVHHAAQNVKKVRGELEPYIHMTEDDALWAVMRTCDPKTEEGGWIAMIDLVERGDQLTLVQQRAHGQCNAECRTMAYACELIQSEVEEDFTEKLYANKYTEEFLTETVCSKLTSSCSRPAPPLNPSRPAGKAFVEQLASERELDMLDKTPDKFYPRRQYRPVPYKDVKVITDNTISVPVGRKLKRGADGELLTKPLPKKNRPEVKYVPVPADYVPPAEDAVSTAEPAPAPAPVHAEDL
eukprot:m.352882 g.352882  ORF g.352882 m.352882 type:complete len:308 (+) comp55915_c0_seq1:30-953(+)